MKKTIAALTLLLCTAAYVGAQSNIDPCTGQKSTAPIAQAASTTLVLGSPARKNYVCSLAIVSPDAEKISVVEGTGTACATTPLALVGATTAASGMSLAANSVLTYGNGTGTVAAGTNANFNICLLQSGAGVVSGVMTYVQQ